MSDDAENITLAAQIEVSEFKVINNLVASFSVLREESVNMSCSITDNWLENNTAVQDAIAINPVTITLRGLVGEVVFKTPHEFADTVIGKINDVYNKYLPVNKIGLDITDKLAGIPIILPEVDNYTQIARNAIDYTENIYNNIKNALQKIKNKTSPLWTEQQEFVKTIAYAKNKRTPFTIYSYYGTFPNMYIQDFNAAQSNSYSQSEISITLKQLNFADSVTYAEADKAVMEKYTSYATSEFENNGKAKGRRKTFAATAWDSRK